MTAPRTPARWILLVFAAVALLLLPGPTYSQSAVTLTAVAAFEGNYLPGAWLPVEVRLSNGGPAVQALVTATLPDSTFRNVQSVELPTGSEKSLTLYVAMEQASRELRLSVEADGSVLAAQDLEVRPRADERMLGLLAPASLQLSLPRRQDLPSLPFTTVSLTPGALPARAEGLSSLSLLLISGAPSEALTQAQIDALLGWVHAGGHLLLGGDPATAQGLAGLPPALQPATVGPAAQISDAPLAALAETTGPGPLPGALLTPAGDARVVGPAEAPAWVTRRVGQGAVTQLAFDPGLPALATWAGAPQFWNQLLRPPTLVSTPLGLQPRADVIQEQIIAGALTSLPAVSLPPANLLFAILAAYAVLVGPGLALLLRRYDRQAWAWAAVPAMALATGALAFGLAFTLRADQRVINQLSLVEAVDAGQARARTYLAALSPQTQTLAAELGLPALVRPVRGASGAYGTVGGSRGDIVQETSGVGLNIDAWQLQGVLAESQLPLAGFSAELVAGPDGPRVELRNESDQPLRGVVAVYGERVAFLGDLRPGERLTAVWPGEPLGETPRGTPISYLVLGEALDAGREAGQAPDRRVLAQEALINAAVARGSAGFDDGPMVLGWMERSPLDFAVEADGAALQETTLLVLRPTIGGSGPVSLPEGWLRPDLAALGGAPCNSELGAGIPTASPPITVPMRLPDGLNALRAETLKLTLVSAGRWPNVGVTTELYDWDQGQWVEQEFDGPGDLELAAAGPYLRGGELLLRLDGPTGPAQCLYVSAEVQGALP